MPFWVKPEMDAATMIEQASIMRERYNSAMARGERDPKLGWAKRGKEAQGRNRPTKQSVQRSDSQGSWAIRGSWHKSFFNNAFVAVPGDNDRVEKTIL